MDAQLADLDRQFATVADEIRARFGGLSSNDLRRRVEPDRWSIAECVAHLTLTTHAFLPMLDEAVVRAPARTGRSRLRKSLLGGLLARALEPPARRRFKTTAGFVPEVAESGGDVLVEFARSQDELRKCLASSEGRDISRVRVASAFNKRLTYNVYTAFIILAAHERRHVWQAADVRARQTRAS